MTPHNPTKGSPPSPAVVCQDHDLVATRRNLEWEMAQKLFALASHLIMRLRLDPACPSPAQIGSLLELASRFARLACDAPQPAAVSPPDSGLLPPEIEAALARVYGPTSHPAPSSGAPGAVNSQLSTLNPQPSDER